MAGLQPLLLLTLLLCLLAPGRGGAEEEGVAGGRGRLAFLLSKRSASLLAPPMAHVGRLAPYLRRRVAKRDDGYWIWMPANGYMAVPKDEGIHPNANRGESTSLMRYG